MSFSELFIRRPVTTVLVMAGILFFGITAYRRLPVSDLPTVDFPTITVNASLPGASPETMASAVATPLEKQFSTIAGIDNMTSTSTSARRSITIQFSLERNIDAAAQDVQAMIAKTLRDLPPGIIPPSYQKVNPADQPILFFALTSALMPLSQLDEYAETLMAQRHLDDAGRGAGERVRLAEVRRARAARSDALAHRQLGIDEVADAIAAQNVNLPTGMLNGPNKAYTVQANGQLRTPRRSASSSSRTATARRFIWASSVRCSTTSKTTIADSVIDRGDAFAVGQLTNSFDDAFAPIEDNLIAAMSLGQLGLLLGRHCADDPKPKQLRPLRSNEAHAPCSRVDKNGVACLHPRVGF